MIVAAVADHFHLCCVVWPADAHADEPHAAKLHAKLSYML